MNKTTAYIIANFGGPRSLEEITPFLCELLTDRDVIRSQFPDWLHNLIFRRVARKRAKSVAVDYELIGGKSPIYADTEELARLLQRYLDGPVIPFHRYLPATHAAFKERLSAIECSRFAVFPLFPQFTYATTGSIARWFQGHLPKELVTKMRWVKSYASHPRFIAIHQRLIREFMLKHALRREECILLFSAHGVPVSFIAEGDIYLDECIASFERVKEAFPDCLCRLAFQSQFGKEEWVKPSTGQLCEEVLKWREGRKAVLFIPITFTSDHIETLFEVEEQYMSVVREKGLKAYRIPALTFDAEWIETIADIINAEEFCNNQMLIRN